VNPWLIVVVAGFAFSAIAGWAAIGIARRLAFIDRPGAEAHKQHGRAVPYGGGAAMAVALAATLLLAWLPLTAEDLRHGLDIRGDMVPVIVVGALALFVVGLVDDRRPLRARTKLLLQGAVCAGAVAYGDIGIDSLRHMPWLSYGIAWFWLLLVTNAYNLLDHADGLSAGVALVSACVLLLGSLLTDDLPLALLWTGLIGVLGGFLLWNLPPARIYMGDAGSLPLGFLIGCGTLSVTFWSSGEGGSPLAVLSPVLITAIPLFDTAVVVVKRLRRRKPIMQGDRNHISHRLVRLGMGPNGSLATVLALQIALAAGTLQLRDQEWMPGLVVLAQSAAIVLVVVLMETTRDDHE
jgi:UDP-GlcNAc:undecaprenyl-phosphate GlcNAc-1-phosphate transferase